MYAIQKLNVHLRWEPIVWGYLTLKEAQHDIKENVPWIKRKLYRIMPSSRRRTIRDVKGIKEYDQRTS